MFYGKNHPGLGESMLRLFCLCWHQNSQFYAGQLGL